MKSCFKRHPSITGRRVHEMDIVRVKKWFEEMTLTACEYRKLYQECKDPKKRATLLKTWRFYMDKAGTIKSVLGLLKLS